MLRLELRPAVMFLIAVLYLLATHEASQDREPAERSGAVPQNPAASFENEHRDIVVSLAPVFTPRERPRAPGWRDRQR